MLFKWRPLFRLSGAEGCVEWTEDAVRGPTEAVPRPLGLGKGATVPVVGVVTADVTTDDGFDGVSVKGSTFGDRSTPENKPDMER